MVSSPASLGFSMELIFICFYGFWSSRAMEKSSSMVSTLTIFSSFQKFMVSRDRVSCGGG